MASETERMCFSVHAVRKCADGTFLHHLAESAATKTVFERHRTHREASSHGTLEDWSDNR